MPWDWRILVNGKGDELLYERGVLDHSVPFAELKRRAYINAEPGPPTTPPIFLSASAPMSREHSRATDLPRQQIVDR
jgi:hypothetical protein